MNGERLYARPLKDSSTSQSAKRRLMSVLMMRLRNRPASTSCTGSNPAKGVPAYSSIFSDICEPYEKHRFHLHWFGSEDAYPQGDGRGVTLPSSRSTWCVSVNAQSEYDSDYDTSFLRDEYDCQFLSKPTWLGNPAYSEYWKSFLPRYRAHFVHYTCTMLVILPVWMTFRAVTQRVSEARAKFLQDFEPTFFCQF